MLPATDSLNSADKDALIGQLLARIDVMTYEAQVISARMETSHAALLAALQAEIVALKAENSQLRAKLDLPPKTPGNSSTPPSRGQKDWAQTRRMTPASASHIPARSVRVKPNAPHHEVCLPSARKKEQ